MGGRRAWEVCTCWVVWRWGFLASVIRCLIFWDTFRWQWFIFKLGLGLLFEQGAGSRECPRLTQEVAEGVLIWSFNSTISPLFCAIVVQLLTERVHKCRSQLSAMENHLRTHMVIMSSASIWQCPGAVCGVATGYAFGPFTIEGAYYSKDVDMSTK